MGFLISHWHCILPIAGIAAAMFFMRDKGEHKKDQAVEKGRTEPYRDRE